jgi:triphosphatase
LFRTDFVRQSYVLELHDGSIVEAVLDLGTVVGGGAEAPICELELELQQGNVAALFSLARAMVAQLPVSLGFQSKAERGYRLAQQQPLTWLTPTEETDLKPWLRAISQNLLLQQQHPSLEQQHALTLLWQQFRAMLPRLQVPILLCQRADGLEIAISGDFQLWLLDFSAWLLEQ